MMKVRVAAGLLGTAALMAAGLTQAPARAATATYCGLGLGAITTGGDHILRGITATTPPTASTNFWGAKDLYPDGQARLAGGLSAVQTATGMKRHQYVVLGSDMYSVSYEVNGFGADVVPGSIKQTRVGGGWGVDFRYFEESRYYSGGTTLARDNTYALQNGNLNRWTVTPAGWTRKAVYTGYSAVKTMALISQTATYDTFLANTYGGALYTIHIPVSGTPVVKKVRTSTWQGFEALVAAKCGQGTLLLGVDKDSGAPYMYAVSRANGAATVIQGLGKVNRTYAETAYFHYFSDPPWDGNLSGE